MCLKICPKAVLANELSVITVIFRIVAIPVTDVLCIRYSFFKSGLICCLCCGKLYNQAKQANVVIFVVCKLNIRKRIRQIKSVLYRVTIFHLEHDAQIGVTICTNIFHIGRL